MPRYKLSPIERAAEQERKENLRNIMKGLDVKNFEDLKDVFILMVGEMLENGLEGELDDELGYTKYNYRNKEGENSRNGYSKKTLKTSFGETEIKVPRDREEVSRYPGNPLHHRSRALLQNNALRPLPSLRVLNGTCPYFAPFVNIFKKKIRK